MEWFATYFNFLFSDSWFSKIKTSVPPDNKHLKATNLRKILVAIVDFNDILPFVSLPDFGQPNVNLAAEGQPEEIGEFPNYRVRMSQVYILKWL